MFYVCAREQSHYDMAAMNFALAFLSFVVFAFFMGWGIVLLMTGSPWLLVVSLLVFLGAFTKYGCLSQ